MDRFPPEAHAPGAPAPHVPAFLDRGPAPRDGAEWLVVHQVWDDLVLDSRHFGPGDQITLGEATRRRFKLLGVDLGSVPPWLSPALSLVPAWGEVVDEPVETFRAPVPGDEDAHVLFAATHGGWEARVRADWPVTITLGGRIWSLAELASAGAARRVADDWCILLNPDQQISVRVGRITFCAWRTDRPTATGRAAPRVEPGLTLSTSLMTTLAVALVTMVALAPSVPEVTLQQVVERARDIPFYRPPAPKPAPPKPRSDAATPGQRSAERAPAPASKSDEQVVAESGVIALLDQDMLGGSQISDLAAATKRWIVSKQSGGPSVLAGRPGLRSGGTADGSGTWTVGGRPGPGGGGCIGGSCIGKAEGTLSSPPGEIQAIGQLTAAEIDEVVRNHMAQIRYCYQRQLQRNPGLVGKVVVKFTIASDGSVAEAKIRSSSLDNPDVDRCLINRFMRMNFPAPRGNGIVLVSYPFLFSPT
ncbi:MAG: TonB family protein [Myxococcales bacterium]|nr:TonB family protein [Myxococcales bacterium]